MSPAHPLRRLLAALALTLGCGLAQADFVPVTLNFDDLPTVPVGAQMADGYGGFDWGDQWYQMSPASAPETNFLATSTTGGTFIRRSDGGSFYFDGADFWSRRGLDAIGDFYFVLYGANGQTVWNGVVEDERIRFTNVAQTFRPDYTGPISGMAFAFDNDDYDHLAMDNFRVRVDAVSAVPEPSSLGLLALGLAGVAWRRRR